MTAPEAEALRAELEARVAERIRSLLKADRPVIPGLPTSDQKVAGGWRLRLRLDRDAESVVLVTPAGVEIGMAFLSEPGPLAAFVDGAARDMARSVLSSLSDELLLVLHLGVRGETLAADIVRISDEILAEDVHEL